MAASQMLVLGDSDRADAGRMVADRIINRCRKATIHHVLGRVAERLNPPRERRWQLSVDEKAQSRAPQDGVIVLAGGEFQYCGDVFRFEVRIVRKNLLARLACGEQSEQPRHRKPQPAYTWFSGANGRIDGDSSEFHEPNIARAGFVPYSIGRPAWVLRESSEVKPLESDGIATSAIVSGVQPPLRCTMRTGRIWP